MAKNRFTQETVITALRQAKGMITVAARVLSCSPSTIESYVAKYPAIAEARRQEREAVLDLGELALMRAVQAGEAWAVCFLLKTQGKSRGYVERVESTGPNGGPIEVDDVTRLTAAERAQRVERLLDLAGARRARQTARGLDSGTASDST